MWAVITGRNLGSNPQGACIGFNGLLAAAKAPQQGTQLKVRVDDIRGEGN